MENVADSLPSPGNKAGKSERRRQRREALDRQRQRTTQSARVRRWAGWLTAAVVIAAGVFWGGWKIAHAPTLSDAEKQTAALDQCIQHTRVGMHTHAHLAIRINGEDIPIPANVGVSASCMRPVHTHDDSGELHLEFPKPQSVMVKDFFAVWDKVFSPSCILDACNDNGVQVKMLVNGEENSALADYQIQDGDKIEIIYE
jgi:hypothetical protein